LKQVVDDAVVVVVLEVLVREVVVPDPVVVSEVCEVVLSVEVMHTAGSTGSSKHQLSSPAPVRSARNTAG
jgi:hypothetical protein